MAETRSVEIGGVWASGAADPPAVPVSETTYGLSTLTPAQLVEGWPYAKTVDSAKFNEIMKRITSILVMIEKYGMLPWSPLTLYPIGARCMGSNNIIYRAIDTASNKNPTTETTYWTQDSAIYSGLTMVFGEVAAPIGWTRKTNWANGAMLCVRSTGTPTSGGTADPREGHRHSGPSHTHPISHVHATANHELTVAEIPSHYHTVANYGNSGTTYGKWFYGDRGSGDLQPSNRTDYTGGGDGHNHGNTGASSAANSGVGGTANTGLNDVPRYQELMACTKD